eukprot:2277537-Pyramimonas_sp.AAC.1
MVNSAEFVSTMSPMSTLKNLASSSEVGCKRRAGRTSWRQPAQRWLNAPRGLRCVREERLE